MNTTEAERAIQDAIEEVQLLGQDAALTDILLMLQSAKDELTNYLDD